LISAGAPPQTPQGAHSADPLVGFYGVLLLRKRRRGEEKQGPSQLKFLATPLKVVNRKPAGLHQGIKMQATNFHSFTTSSDIKRFQNSFASQHNSELNYKYVIRWLFTPFLTKIQLTVYIKTACLRPC